MSGTGEETEVGETMGTCSLDLKCPAEAHMLGAWSPGWCYQEVVEPWEGMPREVVGLWMQALKRRLTLHLPSLTFLALR